MMLSVEDALYLSAPTTPIKLDQLEDAVKRRFQLLLGASQGSFDSSAIERMEPLTDIHAHFGLRVIFAAPPEDSPSESGSREHADMCAWYINQETQLFRLRMLHSFKRNSTVATTRAIRSVLGALNVSYDDVDGYLLVPFQDAPFLLRARSVVLHAGLCRIPFQSREATDVLAHHARRHFASLFHIQTRACRVHVQNQDLERLWPLRSHVLAVLRDALRPAVDPRHLQLSHLPRVTSDADLRAAAPFLPLCMRYLADKLRENHHLKYDGRKQLGLFLKGVGFTVEESLVFWRQAFDPVTSVQIFDKKYAYNIRHSYGLEGSRVQYDPKTCDDVQKLPPPAAGQFHGCPFRHWDVSFLHSQLSKYGVPHAAQIADAASPTAACLAHLHVAVVQVDQ
ncbi:hypothetical protein DYB35_000521 [Aphanomyces astaci]|uniref:DNA primase large subunit C-terminal domain-containing protein n=1 Tax=Aphanomyces astaci TaxID=112090 RepID=A0A3R7AZV6_APHAT|nr:hypothetical protein DYB35_000521 [Aphanomyces astaci]